MCARPVPPSPAVWPSASFDRFGLLRPRLQSSRVQIADVALLALRARDGRDRPAAAEEQASRGEGSQRNQSDTEGFDRSSLLEWSREPPNGNRGSKRRAPAGTP
jgi:hypothetical protein